MRESSGCRMGSSAQRLHEHRCNSCQTYTCQCHQRTCTAMSYSYCKVCSSSCITLLGAKDRSCPSTDPFHARNDTYCPLCIAPMSRNVYKGRSYSQSYRQQRLLGQQRGALRGASFHQALLFDYLQGKSKGKLKGVFRYYQQGKKITWYLHFEIY